MVYLSKLAMASKISRGLISLAIFNQYNFWCFIGINKTYGSKVGLIIEHVYFD